MKPRQVFAPDRQEYKEVEALMRKMGDFAILHDHRRDYGCSGDCLMLNLPDEIRSELSDEV